MENIISGSVNRHRIIIKSNFFSISTVELRKCIQKLEKEYGWINNVLLLMYFNMTKMNIRKCRKTTKNAHWSLKYREIHTKQNRLCQSVIPFVVCFINRNNAAANKSRGTTTLLFNSNVSLRFIFHFFSKPWQILAFFFNEMNRFDFYMIVIHSNLLRFASYPLNNGFVEVLFLLFFFYFVPMQ